MSTTPVEQHPSLPFPRPQGGDEYVAAAHRANGGAAADLQAQRARPRFSGFGSDLTGAHAKINNAVQRLDSMWSILCDLKSEFHAFCDEVALRIEQTAAMGLRHDEMLSEHVDELYALRRRVTVLEANQDVHSEFHAFLDEHADDQAVA